MISTPISLEDIESMLEKLKPKYVIFMNQKTYEDVCKLTDFIPSNIEVSNYIEDGQAVIIDSEKLKMKPFIQGISNYYQM